MTFNQCRSLRATLKSRIDDLLARQKSKIGADEVHSLERFEEKLKTIERSFRARSARHGNDHDSFVNKRKAAPAPIAIRPVYFNSIAYSEAITELSDLQNNHKILQDKYLLECEKSANLLIEVSCLRQRESILVKYFLSNP